MRNNYLKSYAKINLALNIVCKSSKLHKIESLIAFLDFHDLILLKKIKFIRINKIIPSKNASYN